jgi:hypothetical protein
MFRPMKNCLALGFCLISGCLLLAGCTDADWDHVMNYSGLAQEPEAAPTAAPQRAAVSEPATIIATPAAPSEPANADFCRSVATQDAGSNGFDPATQARVFRQSYGQCLAIYTR